MRMLLHEPTGRLYTWHRQLKNADGMVEIERPDEPEVVEPVEPVGSDEEDLFALTIQELRTLVKEEAAVRGDSVRVFTMNKASLVEYMKGAAQ